jgi:ATP-dependent DNA ligase
LQARRALRSPSSDFGGNASARTQPAWWFRLFSQQDLEGIVAKHDAGRYGEDEPTRWLKIKNPEYTQARDRAELFHPASRSDSE